MSIQDLFNNLDDICEPVSLTDEEMVDGTALFSWSKKGYGFGMLYFYFKEDDNGKKVLHCDNEYMSKERVKEILCNMVDNAVFGDE